MEDRSFEWLDRVLRGGGLADALLPMAAMTTALITGISGQDGYYLAKHLQALGTTVWGMSRTGTVPSDLEGVLAAPAAELSDDASIDRVLSVVRPDEIYHLAAQSSVGRSWQDPVGTGDITGLGTARLLEAARERLPAARIFVASSSEVFGDAVSTPQSERSPLRPISPYGAAKAYAHQLASMYRRRYDMFVAVGILYNHESPRRPPTFVTRKITRGAARIAAGLDDRLRLGNLDAIRDWSYAGDLVVAMHRMLQHPEPGDFVLASGQGHVVRDWCDIAFRAVGLDYLDFVESAPEFWRPAEPVPLIGDIAKARSLLGWQPQITFDELVQLLLQADISRLKQEDEN